MSTTDDFVGRDCPLCGAVDSLEADEARGEVACTECAKVVCLGLEESLQTRFVKDATFEDADNRASPHLSSPDQIWSTRMGRTGTLTRQEAVNALHRRGAASQQGNYGSDGQSGVQSSSLSTSPEVIEETYCRTILHPRITQRLEALCKLSRRPVHLLLPRATAIAKHFIGARRSRGDKVDKIFETATACVVLAAEQVSLPIPIAELRMMDPTIRDIEVRRRDIIAETKRTEEFDVQLRSQFSTNLTRYYIRLLYLQRSAYEMACETLFEAVQSLVPTTFELAQLVDAERVVGVVLLARTDHRLQWPSRPSYSPSSAFVGVSENNLVEEGREEEETFTPAAAATFYQEFAKLAQLPTSRVLKIMETMTSFVPKLVPIFQEKYQAAANAKKSGGNQSDYSSLSTTSQSEPVTSYAKSEKSALKSENNSLGVKRERSP